MARNYNAYNRRQIAENEIIGGIRLGSSKSRRRSSFSSRQPRIAHDSYTIKMELEISEKRYDSFIDSNGKKVPIHESYLYYAPTDDNFFEELDVVVIDDENEKTSKHRKFKSRHWEEHKSIEEFFWPRPSFKNRHGVGLYKDYNPKLNSGAPGNVKERRRCERIFAEDSKWNPIIIDYYEEDNIIDTILEDDEVTKTFDMVIVILDDYYVNRKAS